MYFDAKRGLWCGELMVGYKPNGKADKRRVTAKRQDDVRRKLDDLKARASTGLLGDSATGRETFGAFLERWLESIDGTMEPGSHRRHRDNIRRHIKPLVGHQKLSDLKSAHIVAMLAGIRKGETLKAVAKQQADENGRGRKKEPAKPAARTVKYCYTTVRRALDAAVQWGMVPRNVARGVDAPKVPRVEITAMPPADVARLLETAEAAGDRHASLFTLAVLAGCRKGELLALRWDDVDLTSGRLSIRRALKSLKDGVPEFGDPKTARGRRTLKLSRDAMAALRMQRAQQAEDKLALGPDYTDLGLIFATPLGTPLDPDNLNKRLKAALKRAGLAEHYTFHSLRHSAATMMLAAGVSPKTAADRLGHHSAGFTLDRYVHALESLDEDAADRIQDMLSAHRKAAV